MDLSHLPPDCLEVYNIVMDINKEPHRAHLNLTLNPFYQYSYTMEAAPAPSYQELAAKKRADQLSLIPPEWRLSPTPSVESSPNALAYLRRILTPSELALTEETDITKLLRKLSSGEISSLELTRAFAKRAALAHQLTTCCTEIFFEEAFATAKKMDNYLAQTGKTVGPLHGLPVSIKDLFSVKGVDTSIGNFSHATPIYPPPMLDSLHACMDQY